MSEAHPPQGTPHGGSHGQAQAGHAAPAQGQPHASPQTHPHGTAAPRPVASQQRGPVSPIQPPPAQRLPGQPAHLATGGGIQHSQQLCRTPPPLPAASGAPRQVLPASPRPVPVDDGDGELINLEDDDAISPAAGPAPSSSASVGLAPAPVGQLSMPSKIKVAGSGDKHTYTRFKRPAHVDGTRACRLRTFHGRLSDEGLAFMDDKINERLDNHPEVDVKHVNTNIGPIEGKNGEQAMFVMIWY